MSENGLRSPFPCLLLHTGSLSHLDAGFGQADPHGQLFPHKDVRVVGLGKAAFQLLQLGRREARPVPLLFAGFEVVVAGVAAVAVAARVAAAGHDRVMGVGSMSGVGTG